MANHQIFLFNILTNHTGGYDAGDMVFVEWNDVSEQIEVYLYDGFYDLTPTLQTSGPPLGLIGLDWNLAGTSTLQFCDGTTLNYFSSDANAFPYAVRNQIPDSPSCYIAPVCDLIIDNSPVITAATNTSANDGTVTATATSSNGTIKWALFDFDYNSEGQATGVFNTLYAGVYTIYAKDALGCSATITVNVPVSEDYGVRWYSEWTDTKPGPGKDHKVEILERGYSSASDEVIAGSISATYRTVTDGDERFSQIRASEFTFRAYDTTNFQYQDLYTDDERNFLLKYYRDDGAGYVLQWQGFVNPFLFSEPYTATPYQVEITATDGLATLRDFDFVDQSGNDFLTSSTQLSFISAMLQKLGHSLNIRIACNIYEDSIASTATDDPIAHVSINPAMYYSVNEKEDCATVIKNILKEYTACISQSEGKWIIHRAEETIDDFDYREYSPAGIYLSNGSLSPLVTMSTGDDTNRIALKENSGVMTMLPGYGTFVVKQILNNKVSLLQSYGFEPKDVVPFGPTSTFFSGWGIAINSGTGITWGMQEVDRDNSLGALYVDFSVPSQYKEVVVYSTGSPIEFIVGDQIKISFDHFIYLSQQFPWYTFEFKLKIGNYYLFKDTQVGFTDFSDPGYIPVHVTSYNDWGTYDIVVDCPGESVLTSGTVEFYLKIHNGMTPTGYDKTDLDNETTTLDSAVGMRRVANVDVGSTTIRGYYELDTVPTSGAETIPDQIIPNDFTAIYPKGFKLRGSNNGLIGVDAVLIDNVVVEYLPGGQTSPKFQESEIVVNPNNKRKLEVEIAHGDCPTNINNAKNTYNNFLTYNLEPTGAWTRDGVAESEFIQRILLKTLIGQYKKFSRKLQGSFVSDVHIQPYSTIVETLDNDRLYQVQAFEVDLTKNYYSLELYELKDFTDTTGGGTNPFGGAFDPQQFGDSHD